MNKELENTQKAITIGFLVVGIIYIIIAIATVIYDLINRKSSDWDIIIVLFVCGLGAFIYALFGLISKKELRRRAIKANDERKRTMQLKAFKASYGFVTAILVLIAVSIMKSSEVEVRTMGTSLLFGVIIMWLVYFIIYFIQWLYQKISIRNKEEKE